MEDIEIPEDVELCRGDFKSGGKTCLTKGIEQGLFLNFRRFRFELIGALLRSLPVTHPEGPISLPECPEKNPRKACIIAYGVRK